MLDPSPTDLTPLVLGAALLEPFVDDRTRGRVQGAIGAISRELDTTDASSTPIGTVRSSVTMRSTGDPAVLRKVIETAQRGVLRISYFAPWGNKYDQHVIEPWQIRLVDGAVYLRAYSRTRREPRTFHLSFVSSCVVLPRDKPRQPCPPAAEMWGDPNTGFGIDEHHPGVAVVRLRGAVARWLSRIEWDPAQTDALSADGEVLVRSVPYRSRREFARKLLSYADAITSIEPEDLRNEVLAAANKLRASLDQTLIEQPR